MTSNGLGKAAVAVAGVCSDMLASGDEASLAGIRAPSLIIRIELEHLKLVRQMFEKGPESGGLPECAETLCLVYRQPACRDFNDCRNCDVANSGRESYSGRLLFYDGLRTIDHFDFLKIL